MIDDVPTLDDVLDKIKRDLEWHGPTGRKLGTVVLPRTYAELLYEKLTEKPDECEHCGKEIWW